MKDFDTSDAQLNLSKGTPRFYIMRLPAKPDGLTFSQITHHKNVTQCLGSMTPAPWCGAAMAFCRWSGRQFQNAVGKQLLGL